MLSSGSSDRPGDDIYGKEDLAETFEAQLPRASPKRLDYSSRSSRRHQ